MSPLPRGLWPGTTLFSSKTWQIDLHLLYCFCFVLMFIIALCLQHILHIFEMLKELHEFVEYLGWGVNIWTNSPLPHSHRSAISTISMISSSDNHWLVTNRGNWLRCSMILSILQMNSWILTSQGLYRRRKIYLLWHLISFGGNRWVIRYWIKNS